MLSEQPTRFHFRAAPHHLAFDPQAHIDPAEPTEPGYALVKSGPPVPNDEVELSDRAAIEVRMRWGSNVLAVAHVSPLRSVYAGELSKEHLPVDFFVPVEKLGADRLPLVVHERGVSRLVIPKHVTGFVAHSDGRRVDVGAVRAISAACPELSGAVEYELPEGARAELAFGDLVFSIAGVAAGKPVPQASLVEDRRPFAYFASSLVAMAAFIGSMAFFTPPLNLLDDEGVTKDDLYLMQQYLTAAAERNRKLEAEHDTPDPGAGEAGERAAGDEGQAGKAESKLEKQRLAVKGPRENRDRHLSRHEVLEEARNFGMAGMLSSFDGDPNALVSPFARDTALGSDDESAMGNLFGAVLGEARGSGLALGGLGEGGGGIGAGIGLTSIGTIGDGLGGFGQSRGRGPSREHVARAPAPPRSGNVTVSGHLPPEVIQRIVRQNFGRFRFCYERGLAQNPNLEGRVTARFVIDRTGAVSNVSNGGSDIPSSDVTSCVIRTFYGLSFPQPDNGIVTVTYPIVFSPG